MKALDLIHQQSGTAAIDAAIILGSGLGKLGELLTDKISFPYSQLHGFPGFGVDHSAVSGHGRELLIGTMSGKRIAILTGREHYYEHGNAAAMRPALEILAQMGAETLFLTNSAGSLNTQISPGNLMLISDHINYAGINPLISEPTDNRFVNMVNAYDERLRATSIKIAKKLDIELTEGVYLWYSGPSFETVAEIKMAIILGADAVGMSTAPEVIIARMLGMKVWACSAITNMGAGLGDETISHAHTKAMAPLGAEKLYRLIPQLLEDL